MIKSRSFLCAFMKKKLNFINRLLFFVLAISVIVGCSAVPTYTTPQESSQPTIAVNSPAPSSVVLPSETTVPENLDIVDISDSDDVTMGGKYKLIEVDGGDTRGHREPMVVVDVGFGDREYWAYTNEYGQLVRVIAKEIILQDDKIEPVNSNGRYYSEEAFVPGTERKDLDQGHVIADSLGGVSNAYNITPQDSALNRHGDQAYMEKIIRDAGGCTDFEAIITYPNTDTQIPSRYRYTYKLFGEEFVDEFDNVNPDEVNKILFGDTTFAPETSSKPSGSDKDYDISSVDTNGNGHVSIAEAKAAGFKMPITKDHWLYQYMTDADGDGMVGE